eukprot:scaffold8862_cov122-Isochrysis_galbana.AAC.6
MVSIPSSCAAAERGSPHDTPTRSRVSGRGCDGRRPAGRSAAEPDCPPAWPERRGAGGAAGGASARLRTAADATKLVTPACASTADSVAGGGRRAHQQHIRAPPDIQARLHGEDSPAQQPRVVVDQPPRRESRRARRVHDAHGLVAPHRHRRHRPPQRRRHLAPAHRKQVGRGGGAGSRQHLRLGLIVHHLPREIDAAQPAHVHGRDGPGHQPGAAGRFIGQLVER